LQIQPLPTPDAQRYSSRATHVTRAGVLSYAIGHTWPASAERSKDGWAEWTV